MGLIRITVQGSFSQKQRGVAEFSAMHGGHVQATAEAIKFLSGEFLSDAIKLDHKLHEEGVKPDKGFGKERNES